MGASAIRALSSALSYLQHNQKCSPLNLVYDEWPNFLGSRPMVEALLSRLRHYCHTVHIKGPSLRELQG